MPPEFIARNENSQEKKHHRFLGVRKTRYVVAGIIIIGILIVLYVTSLRAPADFPANYIFKIAEGENLRGVGLSLQDQNIIRSKAAFQVFTVFFGNDRAISYGGYYFEKPVSVIEVARRIAQADRHLVPIRITLPEGYTNTDMSGVFVKKLPEFNAETFLALAKDDEGYLFPDTYFFFPLATEDEIKSRLKQTFDDKTAPLADDISKSGHTLSDIVTMASLVEKEAGEKDDRSIIAGILWKRIELGMALQVDASFLYINGKSSSELTLDDLAIDSPYNTYKYPGLPPGPIDNPGLLSIKAALYPTASPYLFYLHDKNGTIHYAKTFEEHKANKARYL